MKCKEQVDPKLPQRSSLTRRSSFWRRTGSPRWRRQSWHRGQPIHHSMECLRECLSVLWSRFISKQLSPRKSLRPNVFSSTQETKSSELVEPLHISLKLVILHIRRKAQNKLRQLWNNSSSNQYSALKFQIQTSLSVSCFSIPGMLPTWHK